MIYKKILPALLLVVFVQSCNLEPKYNKPKIEAPLEESSQQKTVDISWKNFFEHDDLKRVIELVVKNNRDLELADLNLEIARKNHAISIADLLPQINATGTYTERGVPSQFSRFMAPRQFGASVSLASYEIDFFGRLRNLKKSALQQYLASNEAKNTVKISLIAQTVDSYSNLVLDREILEIIKENLSFEEKRFGLINERYKNGISSENDFLTAKIALEVLKIEYQDYQNLIINDENNLLNLTASYKRKILPQKDISILDIKADETLLEFVPSNSLLSRPDILQAEYNLKSANANIGSARAAFFPSISLTGSYGYGSTDLSTLFDTKSWNFSPTVNLPIFSGGRNVANLKISNLRKKSEIVNYEKAIQSAFTETLNVLEQRKTLKTQLDSYSEILVSKLKLYEIMTASQKQGMANEIDVLSAKIECLTAKRSFLKAKKDYLVSLVNVYKAFGGGVI